VNKVNNYDCSFADLLILDPEEQLLSLGKYVDIATDNENYDFLHTATGWCKKLDCLLTSEDLRLYLFYIEGNCWSTLAQSETKGATFIWDWENPYLEKEVISFRKAAVRLNEDSKVNPEIRARIHCNLANIYSHLGRTTEAIEEYDLAEESFPKHAMTLANRGNLFFSYQSYFSQEDELKLILLWKAEQNFSHALQMELEEPVKAGCLRQKKRIESIANIDLLQGISLIPEEMENAGEEERDYRWWCAYNRLFLNILNDLPEGVRIARTDPLNPAKVTSYKQDSQGLSYIYGTIGLFATIKQEYATARYMLYSGLHPTNEIHYSDKKVALSGDMDFRSYGISLEKIKIAFRLAYSLFDRIAFLINSYFDLGVDSGKVSFSRVWFKNGDKRRGIHDKLKQKENLYLRGLYWMSKDLFYGDEDFKDSLAPEAQQIREMRNAIEHKYFKIPFVKHNLEDLKSARFLFEDTWAYTVSEREFKHATMLLFKLLRSAIMNLVLAVDNEEHEKAKAIPEGSFVVPLSNYAIEDRFKR
jgi:tetratricopeptide (TPR) repeat protein